MHLLLHHNQPVLHKFWHLLLLHVPVLQEQRFRRFPKYKATSVFIKRNGRSCGIFCFSQCGKCGKPGYTGWADTAFGSSCQHNLCIPVLNRTERIADTVCSRSAGCYNVSTFAAKPKLNGDISCCHIGDHHRHHQRINFSRSLRDDFFIVIFNLRKASDS